MGVFSAVVSVFHAAYSDTIDTKRDEELRGMKWLVVSCYSDPGVHRISN